MTADQIIAQFEILIQDSLDQTTELFLLNQVKNTFESSRLWALLQRLDTSQTASTGDTYQTPHTLPGDFALPSPRGIYAASDLIPYIQVPFESQIDFQAITYVYFIDYFAQKFYLAGTPGQSGPIKFFYRAYSPQLDLVVNGGQPWIFPTRFHPILPYLMAIKYFAVDQGDKSRAWDDRWTTFADEIRQTMIEWDDQLQMLALQNESQNLGRDISGYPNIIDMDTGGGSGSSMFG